MLLQLIILQVSGHTKHLTMFADVDRCRCSAFWCWTMNELWCTTLKVYATTIVSFQIRVTLDLRFPFDCVAGVARRSKGPRQFQDKRSRVSRQFQEEFQNSFKASGARLFPFTKRVNTVPTMQLRQFDWCYRHGRFFGRQRINMTSDARAHDHPSAVAPSANHQV